MCLRGSVTLAEEMSRLLGPESRISPGYPRPKLCVPRNRPGERTLVGACTSRRQAKLRRAGARPKDKRRWPRCASSLPLHLRAHLLRRASSRRCRSFPAVRREGDHPLTQGEESIRLEVVGLGRQGVSYGRGRRPLRAMSTGFLGAVRKDAQGCSRQLHL